MGAGNRGTIVLRVGVLVVGLLVLAGFAYRDALLDSWDIYRLGSEDLAVSEAAALKLTVRGPPRAIPALAGKVELLGPIHGEDAGKLNAFRETLISGIIGILKREPHGSYAALHGLLKKDGVRVYGLVQEILWALRAEIRYEDLLEWLEGDSKEAFQIACYALYSGGPAAMPHLERAAAASPSPQVRKSAAELLQGMRGGEGFPPAESKKTDAPRREQAGGAKSSRGVLLFEREYDGVFLCCDKSGSMMEGAKFSQMKAELLRIIDELHEDAEFGIAFFDSSMSSFPWQTGGPARGTPALKAAGLGFILATAPGHGGCALPALRKCFELAAASTARSKCVLFFSDGVPLCGGRDAATYAEEILREVAEELADKVPLHTVFLGPPGGPDEAWMRRLASVSGGSSRTIVP